VKLPSGGLGSLEHDDVGRSLPGFIFAFAFLPRGLTHRLCYRAQISSSDFPSTKRGKPVRTIEIELKWTVSKSPVLPHSGYDNENDSGIP
jgi:hypothetical protein